jgi:hypothetical protein
MLQGLILIDALSSAYWKRKKKRKGKKREELPGGIFFPRETHPIGCAVPGFSQLLGAIKSCFKG